MHRALFALPVLAALTACTGAGDKDGRPSKDSVVTEGPLTTLRGSILSNQSGRVLVPIELTGDEVSFMVTAKTDATYISLEAILDENGDEVVNWKDWLNSKSTQSLTSAFYIYGYDSVVNWPVRDVDRALSAGTWTAQFGATDENGRYINDALVDFVVQTKTDDNIDEGVVKVRLVWAEGLDSRNDLQQAVEGALVRWSEIWAASGQVTNLTNITLDFNNALKLSVVDLGYNVLYLDSSNYYSNVYYTPTNYAPLNNSTTIACTTVLVTECTPATITPSLCRRFAQFV